MANLDDKSKEKIKRVKQTANTLKGQVNERYDKSLETLQTDTDAQLMQAENSFDSAYDNNAIQKEINERQIREYNASIGSTDSGLNRTQLTGVALQKANADSVVGYNKMLFINNIKTALQQGKVSLETQRQGELDAIDNDVLTSVNTIKDEALTNTVTYSDLKNALASIDTSSAAGMAIASKQIYNYATNNTMTKSQVKQLCKIAGINYSDYNKWLKDSYFFSKKADSTGKSSSGTGGGYINTSYVDDKVDDKKIDDTTNKYSNLSRTEMEALSDKEKKEVLSENGVTFTDDDFAEVYSDYLDYTYGMDTSVFEGWTDQDFIDYINEIVSGADDLATLTKLQSQGITEVKILKNNGVICSELESELYDVISGSFVRHQIAFSAKNDPVNQARISRFNEAKKLPKAQISAVK